MLLKNQENAQQENGFRRSTVVPLGETVQNLLQVRDSATRWLPTSHANGANYRELQRFLKSCVALTILHSYRTPSGLPFAPRITAFPSPATRQDCFELIAS
jgi:hypothetical protein